MNVLLTGAFGNVGTSTLDALLERGHRVRAFDLPTKVNLHAARSYEGRVELEWGDLRRPEDVARAVQGRDAVVHLGFVIPRLSATGVNSEDRPDWAREVNVGGTRNLIAAMESEQEPPARTRALPFRRPLLVFASSLHVYGHTQHLPPPRTVEDSPCPVEHYAHHKMEVEAMIQASSLSWSILRLGAALPVRLILDPGMFDVPLENRIEFVHTRDAGAAFAQAVDCPGALCRILLIGGGPRCQLYYREMMEQVLETTGVGPLPARVFSRAPYAVDWLDTCESQRLLGFQSRTFSDYTEDLKRSLGSLRPLVAAARPLIRRWLISRSPYQN